MFTWPLECGANCCRNSDLFPGEEPEFCFEIPAYLDFGFNVHWDVQRFPAVVDRAVAMNANWVRVPMGWNKVEHIQGIYSWDGIDSAVLPWLSATGAKGPIRVLGIIGGSPVWASSDGTEKGFPKDSQAVARWRSFIAAVIARYPEIHFWEIWNEPNNRNFYTGSFHDFMVRILIPAAEEIRLRCPGCSIVGPTLTDTPSASWIGISQFFDNMGNYFVSHLIDVISINHYFSDNYSTLVSRWHGRFNSFNRNGFLSQPVWINETGWPCQAGGACEVTQARWILRLIAFAAETSRIQNVFVYRIVDDTRYGYGDRFGVLSESSYLPPKSAYFTLRDIHEPTCRPVGYPWENGHGPYACLDDTEEDQDGSGVRGCK